jgi:hypothetical protein
MFFYKKIRTSKSSLYFSSFYVLPWAGDHRAEDQHQQNTQKQAEPQDQREASATSSGSETMVVTPSADYVATYAPPDMGHAMVRFLLFLLTAKLWYYWISISVYNHFY